GLVVRTERDPAAMAGAVRNAIWELDKDVTVYDVTTMKDVLYESIARERFTVLLLAIFTAVALILSTVGVYGVISFSVTQRAREIGLRLAIGASPGAVVKMVVGQGARLALIGAGLGLIGALGLTRLMASLLFGTSATDPATFTVVAGLLMAISLLASFVPARRAANTDPVATLRSE